MCASYSTKNGCLACTQLHNRLRHFAWRLTCSLPFSLGRDLPARKAEPPSENWIITGLALVCSLSLKHRSAVDFGYCKPIEARPGFKDGIDGASALALHRPTRLCVNSLRRIWHGMAQACAVEGGDGIVVRLAICKASAGKCRCFAGRSTDSSLL